MNKIDQQRIAKELLDSLTERFLRDADRWPEEWDGFELRWLLMECAHLSAPPDSATKDRRSQFDNDCIVNNF